MFPAKNLSSPALRDHSTAHAGLIRFCGYQVLGLTLTALLLQLFWPVGGGLDHAISLPWVGLDGKFFYRNQWALSHIGHEGLKWLVNVLGLIWLVQWLGSFKIPAWRQKRWFAGYPLLALLVSVTVVSLLKKFSVHACPWDLVQVDAGHIGWLEHLTHAGKCFPGGHASAGFGLLGLYFAYRDSQPVFARWLLLLALVAGSVMGAVQVLRGAHFVSHNLWTLWWCWLVNVVLYSGFCFKRRAAKPLHLPVINAKAG